MASPKGILKGLFNFAAHATAGAAVSIAVKSATFALFGSQAVALGAGALAIGTGSAALQRYRDVQAYNKDHADDKAGFFDLKKTGHSVSRYARRGFLGTTFAAIGSVIGLGIAEWASAEAPVPTSAPAPALPTLDEKIATALAEAKGQVAGEAKGKLAEAFSRAASESTTVKAQAIKDVGYYLANGTDGMTENDALANRMFQLSMDVSNGQNIQALRDLGYQALHGFGMDKNPSLAADLLGKAADAGDRHASVMMSYMKMHNLIPAPR